MKSQRKRIFRYLGIILLLFFVSVSFAWWNDSFLYRKPINITSTTATTNYTVLLNISNSHMETDYSDLRFIDSDDATKLSYWIENYTSTNAFVWVKIPSLPAGTKTIYMYYGNPSATSESDISNTFLLGDDFDGSSLDTSKWSQYSYKGGEGTIAVSNGTLKITSSSGDFNWALFGVISNLNLSSLTTNQYEITTRSRSYYVYEAEFVYISYYYEYANHRRISSIPRHSHWSVDNVLNSEGSRLTTSYSESNPTPFYWFRMRINSSITEFYKGTTNLDMVKILQNSNNLYNGTGKILIHLWQNQDPSGAYLETDFIFVRPVINSEPTSTFGSEQMPVSLLAPSNDTYTNITSINITFQLPYAETGKCYLYINNTLNATKTGPFIENTNYSFANISFIDGVYTAQVKCDNAPRNSSINTFTIDTIKPSLIVFRINETYYNSTHDYVNITFYVNDTNLNTTDISIKGPTNATANYTSNINNANTTSNFTLAIGNYLINITTKDKASNSNSKIFNLSIGNFTFYTYPIFEDNYENIQINYSQIYNTTYNITIYENLTNTSTTSTLNTTNVSSVVPFYYNLINQTSVNVRFNSTIQFDYNSTLFTYLYNNTAFITTVYKFNLSNVYNCTPSTTSIINFSTLDEQTQSVINTTQTISIIRNNSQLVAFPTQQNLNSVGLCFSNENITGLNASIYYNAYSNTHYPRTNYYDYMNINKNNKASYRLYLISSDVSLPYTFYVKTTGGSAIYPAYVYVNRAGFSDNPVTKGITNIDGTYSTSMQYGVLYSISVVAPGYANRSFNFVPSNIQSITIYLTEDEGNTTTIINNVIKNSTYYTRYNYSTGEYVFSWNGPSEIQYGQTVCYETGPITYLLDQNKAQSGNINMLTATLNTNKSYVCENYLFIGYGVLVVKDVIGTYTPINIIQESDVNILISLIFFLTLIGIFAYTPVLGIIFAPIALILLSLIGFIALDIQTISVLIFILIILFIIMLKR